jgi:peptidoglycan/xylan/chitin deacetylase (PgdA/CDA1 family)
LITFPDSIRAVIDGGHEIAAHGAYHESVPSLGEAEERRLMDLQLSQHEKIVGKRPADTVRPPGISPIGHSKSWRSTASTGTAH